MRRRLRNARDLDALRRDLERQRDARPTVERLPLIIRLHRALARVFGGE
jgi:hypothetical protein